MNKEMLDTLYTTLEAIEDFGSRLDKLESKFESLDSTIKLIKSELETKIEKVVKDALSEILSNITVNNTLEPNTVINVDTSDISKEISKLMGMVSKPITIPPAQVKVDIDTSKFKQVDNSNVLESISKQITESSKESRVLLKELMNKDPVEEKEESCIKSIKVIRDELGLIQSLEVVHE